MTCQEVQTNLSLYLYGELDFAREEALEEHLQSCAFCERALAREKGWHSTLNSERQDAPLELLSQCRRDLRTAIAAEGVKKDPSLFQWNWGAPFGLSSARWSARLALGSFLVFLGFGAARWMDQTGLPAGLGFGQTSEMGLLNPATSRIRDIQTDDNHRVRIFVDQVREREIVGSVNDNDIRQWLLSATKDPADPGIRVYSFEVLQGQDGADVREALLYSIRHDPNAAVRLKALEGLRRFSSDAATRDALKFVLQHDDNPGVRSEAIDLLAPGGGQLQMSPELVGTLQQVARSEQEDDYVRMRCMEMLKKMNAAPTIY